MQSNYRHIHDSRAQADAVWRWLRTHRQLAIGIGLVVIGGLTLATSYYQVEPAEVGVLLRFGKHIDNRNPGPHFKIPFVDKVYKVPVRNQIKVEFGYRSRATTGNRAVRDRSTQKESEMLTGDLNVGVVEWIVQYTISNPESYLFRFRDVRNTLRLMSEASMRAVVGDHSIDELLTGGREGIEVEALARLQELNERYGTGINIEQVKLQDVNVPEPAKPAMREVEEAKQERERLINEAWAQYNKVVPRAEGLAAQTIEEARGYAISRTNTAHGDAERFRLLQDAYRKAPEVTRTRLYLESIGEILPKAERKILVDSKSKGLVPLLNLQGGR